MERKVSLIMTIFNEADNIERVLQGIYDQNRRPDEVIIVDGGSTDGTPGLVVNYSRERMSGVPVTLLSFPGCNISEGRNAAIRAANNEIIAATDAGTRLERNWLEELLKPFLQGLGVEVVAGFFKADPDPSSPFQAAMAATVLPVEKDITPEKFLPSSRSVAFTRKAWEKVGGYPEWLDYCEDLIFDLELKRQGYLFYWQPSASVYFAPRKKLSSFFKQYYRYARGDGKANLFFKRHLLRYLTYLIVGPLMLVLAVKKPWLSGPFLLACGGYLKTPYRRLFQDLPGFHHLTFSAKMAALAWIPLIRLTGDLAKMAGYPPGVWWRLKRFFFR